MSYVQDRCQATVDLGLVKVADGEFVPGDGMTDDKLVDLLSAFVPFGSTLTAPGGRFIATPLRGLGRPMLEGMAGESLGAVAGALVNGVSGGHSPELVPLLVRLGRLTGQIHGNYASRRNIREETGDYSALGFNRDKTRQATPGIL